MKIAIAGAGAVGMFISADLAQAGHEVHLLEVDPDVVEKEAAGLTSVHWHTVDACEFDSLARLDLATVDVMVAATGDDEDNLVISLLAKQEFAVPRVVARVNNPKNHWLFNESWGVDVAVSTPHQLTAMVEEAVSVGTLVRLLQLGNGQARLVEVTLAVGSPAEGRTIAELGVPRDATVVAVIRERHVIVPRGETELRVGDEVVVLVTGEAEADITRLLIG
jgi:trk system potassium uptake protein TrkA